MKRIHFRLISGQIARLGVYLIILAAGTVHADPVSSNKTVDPMVKAYDLSYRSSIKGYDFKTRRSLEAAGSAYKISQTSRALVMKTHEESIFGFEDNRVKPISYNYQRKVFGKKKTRNTRFNEKESLALFSESGESDSTVKTPAGILDMLNYQLQFRQDLMENKGELASNMYPVMDDDRVREYEYRKQGNEWLHTDVGYIETVKFERVREDSSKQTVIWLAKDWDFIVVKVQHTEDGEESYELNLTEGQISGQDITGFDKPKNPQIEHQATVI